MRKPQMPTTRVEPLAGGAILRILRGHRVVDSIHLGRNEVHAFITHEDGSIDDLGISYNLLNTGAGAVAGRDQFANSGGGKKPAGGSGSPFNGAPSTTTFTATGTPWTTNDLVGAKVCAAVTGITTPPVLFRIISNTTSVATGEGWYTEDGVTLGTTPATTNGFVIIPGGAPPRFMALTADASAAAAANVSLTAELTTNALGRKVTTYAHTVNTATYTLQAVFSPTGTQAGIHRIGIFPFLTASGATMCFEAVLNADASVVNGDSLTVTDTVTVS